MNDHKIGQANRALSRFPRVKISVLPTPLHRIERLSRELSINLYCKRDDLTGFALGGNKTRKLDYLIADALRQKADTIVTTGGVQSNFCRIAAAAGKANGMDVHVVLGGARPAKPTGNLLLTYLFGATVHFVDATDWIMWETEASALTKRLTADGKRVYQLPVGGSIPIGVLGYVEAMTEILTDCERLGISIDTIVHATSSAGTQAGLVVGKALTGWHGRIIGMGVAKDKTVLSREVRELAIQTGQLVGATICTDDVIVDDSYIGPGYAVRTKECGEAIGLFAQTEGILLDNVYTGKAAAGLIDYARRNLFRADENVLFIHTGGVVELFA